MASGEGEGKFGRREGEAPRSTAGIALRTWSATRRYQASLGHDPVGLVEPAIREAWGDTPLRRARFPLGILASRP